MLLLSAIVLLINVRAQAPKQAQIVFFSNRDGADLNRKKEWEIYAMDTDGNNQRRLTDHPLENRAPAWSPDGQSIAFVSYRDGNKEIYVMDADGNNQRRLTNNPAFDSGADWFDPAFAVPITSVSHAGKLRSIWGWLKQNSE